MIVDYFMLKWQYKFYYELSGENRFINPKGYIFLLLPEMLKNLLSPIQWVDVTILSYGSIINEKY